MSKFKFEREKTKSINQYVLIRYVKLFAGFWYIYIVARVSTIFFDGRSPAVIYGSGKQGILHTIIDAFGLARYFETPTLCSTWWYMSLAIILIVLIPILRMIYQKVGGAVLIISVIMLPSVLGMKGSANINIYAYLLSCALGIAASESLWFEKLEKVIVKKQMLWTFNIMCTVVFFAALYFRITVGVKTVFAVNALCALMIVFLSRFCFVKIPGLNYILEKIGKHSMNLFLMHTFFYSYYFDTFIYSFKYPVLIVTVLLIVTMLASIALELVKKLIHYDEGVNYICRKLECMS